MPIGYIITLVILSVFTVLALVRIRHFGHKLFMVALPASELPHLGVVLLGLSTLLAWGEGDLTGATGIILAGVALVVLVGLLELLRRALRARPIIHQEIRNQGRRPQRRWTWWVRPLFFSIPVAATIGAQNRSDFLRQ